MFIFIVLPDTAAYTLLSGFFLFFFEGFSMYTAERRKAFEYDETPSQLSHRAARR
jgi:hypothetical protein